MKYRAIAWTVVFILLLFSLPVDTVWADERETVSGNDIVSEVEIREESGANESLECGEGKEADELPECGEVEEAADEPLACEEGEANEPSESEAGEGLVEPEAEMRAEDTAEDEDEQDTEILLFGAEMSFTDAYGNVFAYEPDGDNNATITGITVSGQVLIIPATIDGYSVTAVANGTSRVVRNPGTRIPELTINQATVGVNAFAGCNIGTLTIGENVSSFSCFSTNDWTHSWMQFATSEIDRVVYNATELPISIPSDTNLGVTTYGPFYQAQIKESIVFGENVRLIPEFLFQSAVMDVAEVTINAERIGAYAFAGSEISIGVLTLGEDVRYLEECSDHKATDYMWCQFQGATIGSLHMNSTDLRLGHSKEAFSSFHIYGAFHQATVGNLEIGSGVTQIPEAFLYQANLRQDALSVGAATIEAYAFAGNGIHIGRLTLESSVEVFEESYFSTSAQHYYYQFYNADIDFYCYRAPKLAMGHEMGIGLTNTIYGPFWGAKLGGLEIGENVELIPEYFLDHAAAALGNMTINTQKIGGYAFGGGSISFDVLTIGEGVSEYYETYYSTDLKHYWGQFQSCTINQLVYLPREAVVTHENTGMGSLSSDIYGPFMGANIKKLTLAEDIQQLSDYLFYNSTISEEELILNMPVIGAYAFAGANIHIGTLTVGSGVKSFSLAPDSTSAYYRWQQFYSATIGELRYEASSAETIGFAGDDHHYYGPFVSCKVGRLVLGDSLQKIPAYCFAGMVLNQVELEIHVPVIAPGAFSGANMQIGTLTLGEEVEEFPYVGNSLLYFKQFYQARIGTLKLLSPHIKTTTGSCYRGPFEECTINGLEIGEQVEEISDYLFYNARMTVDELNLQNLKLGYRAFCSSNNTFTVLNVGENVTYSGIGRYTGTLAYSMCCFEKAKITTLNYNGSGTKPVWTTSAGAAGMFAKAVITQLNIGEDAEQIPAGWFRDAVMTQSELTIPCGWAGYAFYGSGIKIGRVNLIGNFAKLSYVGSYDYGFYNSTIGTLYYDLPELEVSLAGSYTTGPFSNAKITNLIIGEHVRYLDDAIFKNCKFSSCLVEAVYASDNFKSQTLTAGYLPTVTNLTVHYNSDFKFYFSQKASSVEWECVNHLDEVSREKVYNEGKGQYELEILNRCTVCGYEIREVGELDETHEVYLSLPVGVDLIYDSVEGQYLGASEVYAYGRLGNAYSGIKLSVDSDAEGYGIAVKSGAELETFDVVRYFTVGFADAESVSFLPEELAENELVLENGEVAIPYKDVLYVSVDGMAFLEGGVGQYQIGIPIKLEFTR